MTVAKSQRVLPAPPLPRVIRAAVLPCDKNINGVKHEGA
jgi:hypothetical protein